MTGMYRVAMATNGACLGALIELPEPYTLTDVSDAITGVMDNGRYYTFYAQYPYGPYQRFVGYEFSIVLKKEA